MAEPAGKFKPANSPNLSHECKQQSRTAAALQAATDISRMMGRALQLHPVQPLLFLQILDWMDLSKLRHTSLNPA